MDDGKDAGSTSSDAVQTTSNGGQVPDNAADVDHYCGGVPSRRVFV